MYEMMFVSKGVYYGEVIEVYGRFESGILVLTSNNSKYKIRVTVIGSGILYGGETREYDMLIRAARQEAKNRRVKNYIPIVIRKNINTFIAGYIDLKRFVVVPLVHTKCMKVLSVDIEV